MSETLPDPTSEGQSTDQDEFFSISSARRGDAVVVTVTGEIDVLTSPRLSEALRAAFAEPCSAVIVDLSGISFFSSTGLSALNEATGTARDVGRGFRVVVGESVAVRRTVEITGLDRVLEIYDSVAAATSETGA